MHLAPRPAASAPTPKHPDLWVAAPDDVTQKGADFHDFFGHPESWLSTAHSVATFSINAPYLLKTSPDIARQELVKLRTLGVALNISLAALPADKNVCGAAIEGMVWPGELALTASRLKALGADVDSFSFDLPLTSGHLSQASGACRYSIADAAERLASEVRGLRKIYPTAKLVDEEVPTGMPAAQWVAILTEWVDAFKRASGEDFYGLTMDVWWKFPWQDTVRETARILDARGIRVGIFLDASAGPALTAPEWIAEAKRNACALRDTHVRMNYIVVANWLDMRVPSLPETNPQTLISLLHWVATGATCTN
jgi:hypothetical protein